jgi:hypothetical protein
LSLAPLSTASGCFTSNPSRSPRIPRRFIRRRRLTWWCLPRKICHA